QHNPYGVQWGNMTWGHAVSRDLVHWDEIGDALYADRLGTMYSGSAVVDHDNTSGLGTGSTPPMVTFFTSAGQHSYEKQPYTQSIAYSLDRGRSWTKYAGNPVVGHIEGTNRDPKVFWHQPSKQWVMALYLSRGKFVLMGSNNLREWRKLSEVEFPDGHECPELFELPVDGDAGNTRWVFWEGGGRHLIGRFDGTRFQPETGVLPAEWGANTYAAQTWNDVPDGRRILIAWMRTREPVYPGMPFNQQMSFPRELELKTTPDGIRLHARPAREIEKLHGKTIEKSGVKLATGSSLLEGVAGELFDIELVIEPDQAETVTLDVRGASVKFDAAERTLSCLGRSMYLGRAAEVLDLRVLVDRTSLEIFAADGRYVMSFCLPAEPEARDVSLTAAGGAATVRSLRLRRLNSIWRK
ncbi:MAG: glycoside hydrolase family 32 protein, partial [bacterium]|nr:glycoside hydrolase family 32 protein [bacterium]